MRGWLPTHETGQASCQSTTVICTMSDYACQQAQTSDACSAGMDWCSNASRDGHRPRCVQQPVKLLSLLSFSHEVQSKTRF